MIKVYILLNYFKFSKMKELIFGGTASPKPPAAYKKIIIKFGGDLPMKKIVGLVSGLMLITMLIVTVSALSQKTHHKRGTKNIAAPN